MSICKLDPDSIGYKTGDIQKCGECIPEVMETYSGDIAKNIVQQAAYQRCLEADTWMSQQRKQGNKVTNEDGVRWAKSDPDTFRSLVRKKANDDLRANGEIRHFFSGSWEMVTSPLDTLQISAGFWSGLYQDSFKPWGENLMDGAALMVDEGPQDFDDWMESWVEDVLGNERDMIVAPPTNLTGSSDTAFA